MTRDEYDQENINAPVPDRPAALRSAFGLTGFQRDLLLVVAGIDQTLPSGKAVRQALEEVLDKEVNESRVYQNLGKLRQAGLVRCRPIDGRTDGYRTTEDGRALIRAYCSWASACLEADAGESGDQDGSE